MMNDEIEGEILHLRTGGGNLLLCLPACSVRVGASRYSPLYDTAFFAVESP
jgi:hypothetical protein